VISTSGKVFVALDLEN